MPPNAPHTRHSVSLSLLQCRAFSVDRMPAFAAPRRLKAESDNAARDVPRQVTIVPPTPTLAPTEWRLPPPWMHRFQAWRGRSPRSDRLAILHAGRVSVAGKPAELRAGLGTDATMDDVFVHYAGGLIHEGGTFREVAQTRRTAHRLG